MGGLAALDPPGQTPPEAVAPGPVNIYSYTVTPHLSPAVANVPLRVYVPNSDAASVSVIDPTTMKVVDRFGVGVRPHHVTPSWDLSKLYVNNTEGNTLTEIDPMTGRPTRNIPITDPYNLYFTPDGTKAIVVAERYQRLDFYNPADWSFIKSVGIPWPGVDQWLAGLIDNTAQLVITGDGRPELGASAAALLLDRHGASTRPFGLETIGEAATERLRFTGYRFTTQHDREDVKRWWAALQKRSDQQATP